MVTSRISTFVKSSLLTILSTLTFSAQAQITQIRFAVDPTYPPFESKQPDGKIIGFDIDLGNAICRQVGAQCHWVESSFDTMIPALKAHKFDAILSDMGITEARLKQINFSIPIYNTPIRLVTHKGKHLEPNAKSLLGMRIGVEQGTVQETYAKAKWQPHGVDVVIYADQSQVESDLLSGQIDALLTDAVQAKIGFLSQPRAKGFALTGQPIPSKGLVGPTAIGLRKNDTQLKAAIDNALITLAQNGTLQKIQKKYFETDIIVIPQQHR
ncbi:transporter substrate-binding domain-containing protein [Celerinatantimonas yamalensis]|uniref:Transporter substrate-binding domain-containing protein n=1 Tax=Celerinatantimonas yamalensis TaxID=559956 RepID=A0ABW9G4D3_9GAMM